MLNDDKLKQITIIDTLYIQTQLTSNYRVNKGTISVGIFNELED
jgi:hypothetical protein